MFVYGSIPNSFRITTPLRYSLILPALLFFSPATLLAGVVSFGAGPNQFSIEFVSIGDAGNAPAPPFGTPYGWSGGAVSNPGSVGYVYELGKYEVSREVITKYNSAFGTSSGLEISLMNMSSFGGNGANKPAAGISWNEAARFVNWLNTSSGYSPAYKFTTNGVNDDIQLWNSNEAGYDPANRFRNSRAVYVLPSLNEWVKAAYYNPVTKTYHGYISNSGVAPVHVPNGTVLNTAVFKQPLYQGPADITVAGGLGVFGLIGMGGNVSEWAESAYDTVNDNIGSHISTPVEIRNVLGGYWYSDYNALTFGYNNAGNPYFDPSQPLGNEAIGIRIARLSFNATAPVPEPGTTLLTAACLLGFLWNRWNRKRGIAGHLQRC